MDEIPRTSSGDTLNKQLGALTLPPGGPVSRLPLNDIVLVSCHLDANASPATIRLEKVPIVTPKYLEERKETTEQDLYFLRWVFRGLFDQLTASINAIHAGYKILRCEVEPGISWDDFRADRRGLLLWLVPSIPDPMAHLRTVFAKLATDDKAVVRASISVVERQVSVTRQRLQGLRDQVSKADQDLSRVCKSIVECYRELDDTEGSDGEAPMTASPVRVKGVPTLATPKRRTNGQSSRTMSGSDAPGREAGEWSVVEDEDDDDDDKELTSASLSGYDEYDSY